MTSDQNDSQHPVGPRTLADTDVPRSGPRESGHGAGEADVARSAAHLAARAMARPKGSTRTLTRGATIGRYVVLDRLGHGGTGEVLRALDPHLERIVALKLVLVEDTARSDALLRLVREAQAIARLSHPNVVQVFDVSTDRGSGDIFIAMEFVDGATLRAWLRSARPTTREIFDVFAQAGEGLLAAHAAGIVHRDFKPENVLVDRRGRARVLDFGLAKSTRQIAAHGPESPVTSVSSASSSTPRSAATQPVDADPPATASERTARALQAPAAPTSVEAGELATTPRPLVDLRRSPLSGAAITDLGARVGTPAYMPPEQIMGGALDARADQYAFATALWEALFGELPFEGESVEASTDAKLRGRRRPLPTRPKIPRAVALAMERALATAAEDRYDSLRVLVSALAHAARVPSVPWPLVSAGLAGSAALAVGLLGWMPTESPEAGCDDSLARLDSAWSISRREDVRRGLSSVARPFAVDVTERALARLDDAATRWRELTRETCSSTRDPLTEARALCLARAVDRFERATETFAHADDAVLERAATSADALVDTIDRCADVAHNEDLLTERRKIVSDADREVLASLAAASELRALGRIEDADALLASVERPDDLLAWPSLVRAHWAMEFAKSRLQQGDATAADGLLEDVEATLVGEALPTILRFEWLCLRAEILSWIREPERLRVALEHARDFGEHALGATNPEVVLATARLGEAAWVIGDYEGALAERETAARRLRALGRGPEDRTLTLVEIWRHEAASALGRDDEAVSGLRDLVERAEVLWGAQHPETISARHTFASALARAGQLDLAVEEFERVLRLVREDPENTDLDTWVGVLGNVGAMSLALGRLDAAEAHLREALELVEASPDGTASPNWAALRANLGSVALRRGDPASAIELLEGGLRALEAKGQEHTTNAVMTRVSLSSALREAGKPALARAQLEAAAVSAKSIGNPDVEGQVAEAIAELDAAAKRPAPAATPGGAEPDERARDAPALEGPTIEAPTEE